MKPLPLPKTLHSISITYGTRGEDRGKIVKLVTDMVLDRQIGNTLGQSGVAAAAVVGGYAPPDDAPPLAALGRLFGRPLKYMDYGATVRSSYQPPFPESVMIQLTKGVLASNFGLVSLFISLYSPMSNMGCIRSSAQLITLEQRVA